MNSSAQQISDYHSLPLKITKPSQQHQQHGSGTMSQSEAGEQISGGAPNSGLAGTSVKVESKKDHSTYKAQMRSRTSSQNSKSSSSSRAEKTSKRATKTWTEEEDRLLRFYYSKHNGKWPAIAAEMADRSASQCSQRWRRIKPSKIRRPWSEEEDVIVMQLIAQHGKNWGIISSQMDNRSGKQVRERYINKLDPQLNNELFTEDEDRTIIDKYYKIGPKWSEIAKYLVGRSENMVKNRFYSYIKKTYAINSLQGPRSDTGSWCDATSSPRLQTQGHEDKNSSYVSSHYNDLDPSIGSDNIEGEDSSSENDQYNQFSLGPNPALQHHSKLEEENSFGPSYDQPIAHISSPFMQSQLSSQQPLGSMQQQQQLSQQFGGMFMPNGNQQQYQQQNVYSTPNSQYPQNQNQSAANATGLFMNDSNNGMYEKKAANTWAKQEKAEEMFHTPRLALANNQQFFPTEMYLQQRLQEEIMNSNGQQALGNNFFQGAPSPLILLSPAQGKTDQFSFVLNTPNPPRYILSNSNTPYHQAQQPGNNPNSLTSLNSQGQNNHFNFSNIASTPNYKPVQLQQPTGLQQQQQQQQVIQPAHQQQQLQQPQQYIYPNPPQQQQLQPMDLNGNLTNSTCSFNFPINNSKGHSFEENFEALTLNTQHQVSQGNNQFFLSPISPNQQNLFINDYQQQLFYQQQQQQQQQHQSQQQQQQHQHQQQPQYPQQQQQSQQSQQQYHQFQFQQNPSEQLNLQDNSTGGAANQFGNPYYINSQQNSGQRAINQSHNRLGNNSNSPLNQSTGGSQNTGLITNTVYQTTTPPASIGTSDSLSSNSNPREELRIDISYGQGSRFEQQQQQQQQQQQIQQQQPQPVAQNPLATPKINKKHFKNLIGDLEAQLQLLRTQYTNLNDEDSDC